MLDVVAIVLSLVLLMGIAYRGLPVVVFAPGCAVLAIVLSGSMALPGYTETYMGGAAGFIRGFFPLFLLGAIFGKLMDASGSASSVAGAILQALGPRHAISAVVLACGVLTYGGVSLFVVAFGVYPFGAALFRAANIPKRLLPGSIALGAFTLTMDCLPGSPQVQNLIPTRYFGTDAYAAPWLGISGGLVILVSGLFWLDRRRARAAASGEGYGEEHRLEPLARALGDHPRLVVAIIPMLLVLILNFALSRTAWSVAFWYPESLLKRNFPATDPKAAAATWALIVALLGGIGATLALHFRRLSGDLAATLSTATSGALLAVFNTASEVGYGTVIKSLPGFVSIRGWVLGASRHVLISESIAVNVLAGVTGSASGGLSIALEVMGRPYLELARAQGISPEALHRIAAMSSGGLDTLPHNGAVITLLAITGLTHRQAYADIFAMTVIKALTAFALAVAVSFAH